MKSKVIRREQPQRKSRSVSPVKSNKVKNPEILPTSTPTISDHQPVMSSASSPRYNLHGRNRIEIVSKHFVLLLEKLKLSRRKVAETLVVKINERQEVFQHPLRRMTPIITFTGILTLQRRFFFTDWNQILSRNRCLKMQILGIHYICSQYGIFFCHFMLLRQIRGLSRFWDSL